MLQSRTLGLITIVGVLATTAVSTAARADQRIYYGGSSGGNYGSDPQIRLGVDVIWGGHSYAPPPPPVVWVPAPRPPAAWYPAYYVPDHYYYQGNGRGHYKHRKHRHQPERWDDRDD